MRRVNLILALPLLLIVVTACASPAPTAEPAAPTEPAAQPTEAAAEPTASVVEPTQAPAAQAATRVEITLADNTIASSLTAFKAGVPYTFVINNTGRREHNFNITPPVAVAGSINAALDAALLSVDETQLAPGGSASIDFTFPVSAVGAQLELNCLIRRHYEDGMRVDITVTG